MSGDEERTPRPRPPLRDAATHVVRVLRDAGYESYFAGGCVRDRLMGIEPIDYDVVTDARPEVICTLFRRAHSVGEAFGVVLVRHHGHVIEVATFRTDGVYADGRHPDTVTFSDARHDATRRDFTVNGLFEDPIDGRIIDHVDGEADLSAKIIRAIGDPVARLSEDHLRMLRAVRFTARFGFDLDDRTAEAIHAAAGNLEGVSRERIGTEIRRMMEHENRAVAAWQLQYLGLDEPVLGEPSLKVAPTRLGGIPDEVAYPTALAAWLLDRHQETPSDEYDRVALRWADRLVLSNAERAALRACLEAYLVLVNHWLFLGVAQQKRLAASPTFIEALILVATTDRPLFVDIRMRVSDLSRSGLAPEPLLDGSDLIAAGLRPGPLFKQLLNAAYDAQLEGAVQSRDEALELVRAILDEHGGAE